MIYFRWPLICAKNIPTYFWRLKHAVENKLAYWQHPLAAAKKSRVQIIFSGWPRAGPQKIMSIFNAELLLKWCHRE
jgi:hypothetical protein